MSKLFSLLLCFAMLFVYCSGGPLAGGSTDTELGTVVAGVFYDEQGKPASNAVVLLISPEYNPLQDAPLSDSLKDTTGPGGMYKFKTKHNASYNIQARQNFSKTAALITGVTVNSQDTIFVRNDTLRQTGTLKILLPDAFDAQSGYVYVPGTTMFTRAKAANGYIFLDSVPQAVLPSLFYVDKNLPAPMLMADSIVVSAGAISVVSFNAWLYSGKLVLNTTGSGAAVFGNVRDFPVLVRLTNSNFDFGLAKSDGADIRFTKPDNTPLSYEIERWDSANGLAEIWVKADTVYGNDSTHFITMFWGNSNAISASNSAAVFDTGNGFGGVWHLGQPAHAIAPDATINHYDGTPSDTAPVPVGGAVGLAQSFDGVSNFIEMKGTGSGKLNFPVHGFYTVSAWAFIDSFKTIVPGLNDHIDIVAKGNFEYHLQVNGTIWQFAEYQDMVGWDHTRGNAEAGKWTYVTGIRKGLSQYLYVNGTCVDSALVNAPGVAPRDTTKNVAIGRLSYLPIYYFDGKIDEVRISGTSRSADWEKLCYMNQKATDALVKYEISAP